MPKESPVGGSESFQDSSDSVTMDNTMNNMYHTFMSDNSRVNFRKSNTINSQF
eukprot:CAMPEP_0170466578 /NCGR_PEP_ID=MMETSP0123-20130129/10487_1 /TAXON_ID=182087 /ORGANISM="Favella ehrenbergii, Strain Fehren 1" /LENGTH=52 /DNA_ID=CAMNT_0010732745 /DNA_START=160 /DNA_END=318 /DNA_ORIENTATION=+